VIETAALYKFASSLACNLRNKTISFYLKNDLAYFNTSVVVVNAAVVVLKIFLMAFIFSQIDTHYNAF
jgi:hypothetical protein